MDKYLFDKEVTCHVCNMTFTTKKPRIRKIPVEKKDADFHIWYKEVNPVFYNVWVCPNCGFSVTESEHKPLNIESKSLVLKHVSFKWNKRDYGSERNWDQAVETHKLAIFMGQLLKKPNGYLGGLSLRLAWLYREMNSPHEETYLQHALSYLEKAYAEEEFPIAGLDEVSLSYLIGELKRSTGEPKEAIFWYNRALEHPNIKNKRLIQLKARDQWQLARDDYNKLKEGAEHV